MNISSFKLDQLEVKPSSVLFPLSPKDVGEAVRANKCPYCFCRLYELRGKNLLYCKSKRHKVKFLVGKDKIR